MKIIQLMCLLVVVLFTIPANAQDDEIFYYPKLPQVNIDEAKTNLARLLKKSTIVEIIGQTKIFHDHNSIKGARVYEDKMEIYLKTQTLELYFLGFLQIKISVKKDSPLPGTKNQISYFVVKAGNFALYGQNADDAREIADYLYFFQKHLNILPLQEQLDSGIVRFKPIVAQYSALKVKPPVSEEQRKYIVQANSFAERKQYVEAIELYKKAVEINWTSYPAAYLNLALLSAQINNFEVAIYYMKIYLMFVPEASDARSGQDKIYEWEARVGK